MNLTAFAHFITKTARSVAASAFFLCIMAAVAQTTATETVFEINFPINSHTVYRTFGDNEATLDSLGRMLKRTKGSRAAVELREVSMNGTASPDGRLTSNIRLANRRMRAMADYISRVYGIDTSLITLGEARVPWDEFRAMIASEPRLLDIVSKGSDDSWLDAGIRMDRLKALDGGRVWRRLAKDVFPRLRRSVVMTVTVEELPEPVESEPCHEPEAEPAVAEPEPAVELAPAPQAEAAPCRRSWHAATNALALSMAIANVQGEYDFGCRWSVAASVYYSAWNYGSVKRKLRTFIFRPEVRYWLSEGHRGFFFDAHIQMAAYNFALPGWKYRIQDVKGHHPALGGGLGAGYRLPLGSKGRWALEAQVGVGCYHLEYNRYENVDNGRLVDRRERTFVGIDNVAVSVVYNFNAFRR